LHTAKPRSNVVGAVPCLTHPKAVFDFISRPLPIAAINCHRTRRLPPGVFILYDGVGLVAKRIEIIPSTTPQMLRISQKALPFAVNSGRLMRYTSSDAWYGLRITIIEHF
jgi:hypothetical protein